VPVCFLSDGTGISAETMGNALQIQFPDLHFERRSFPLHHLGRGDPPGGGRPRRGDGILRYLVPPVPGAAEPATRMLEP
jgi:hypothetical protein